MNTKRTNKLYAELQAKYGKSSPLVNGYRSQKYFEKEQSMLMNLIDPNSEAILDVACGSGLMTLPLFKQGKKVIGLDFNAYSCQLAQQNMTECIEGNAFDMPFEDECFDTVINCQFLNQQQPEDANLFLQESYRILKFDGQLILVWRNGDALIHRVAHTLFSIVDYLTNNPNFPMVNHNLMTICEDANQLGFKEVKKFLVLPFFNWRIKKLDSLAAKVIGASAVLVAQKSNT